MNVLCIGYYDKFSRFFLEIKKDLKNDNLKVNFKILSIYFSGYLFSFLRSKDTSLITYKAWFNAFLKKRAYSKIIKNKRTYKNINFHNCIEFHTKLNKSIKKKHLLLQAISYIDILHKEFSKFNPDILLVIGDSRLVIEIVKKLSIQFKTKIYFIEQGPFNTTIFDSEGVNANASIRKFEINEKTILTNFQKKNINKFTNKIKLSNYNRLFLYRSLDFFLEKLLSNSILFPPDLLNTDTFPKFKIKKDTNKEVLNKTNNQQKTFLLILQVPMDVNMIYHSPYFKNHYSIVRSTHENLPDNSKLIIREHPVYKGKYEKKLYDYCEKYNLYFDTNISLKKSLEFADVVIVNNSTVGIEAIALKKTVIVLGNAYYDNPKICIKYKNDDNLNIILKKAIDYKPNENSIDVFLQELLFNYLIEGFMTDKKLIAAKTISNKLKGELN